MGYRVLKVGRSPQADIRLDDTSVSRRQAYLIVEDDGGLYVVDRSSTNGTWIADDDTWERVERRAVTPEDRLRFGDVAFTVRALLGLAPQRAASASGGAVVVEAPAAGRVGGPTPKGSRAITPAAAGGETPGPATPAGRAAQTADGLPAGRVRRNPLTGEVIVDRDAP